VVSKRTTKVVTDFDWLFSIAVPNFANCSLSSPYIRNGRTRKVVVGNNTNLDVRDATLCPKKWTSNCYRTGNIARKKKSLDYSVGEVDGQKWNLVPQINAYGVDAV